jgi:hypothetical protein
VESFCGFWAFHCPLLSSSRYFGGELEHDGISVLREQEGEPHLSSALTQLSWPIHTAFRNAMLAGKSCKSNNVE